MYNALYNATVVLIRPKDQDQGHDSVKAKANDKAKIDGEGKGKGNVDLYSASTPNALRYGSHSITCKQHHICLYP